MKIVKYPVILFFLCVLGAAFVGVDFYKNESVPENALKIMTYNIGSTQEQPKEYIVILAAIIKKESPDIVFLQEAYRDKSKKLAELIGYKMLSVPGEIKKKQHVRILSRLPIQFNKAKKLSEYDSVGKNVVCAEIETDKGMLLACSVYLTSIRTELGKDSMNNKTKLASISFEEVVSETCRSLDARELVHWLDSLDYETIVIGGDFNSLFLSKAARTMRGRFNDSAWLTPSLFSSSHKIQKFHLPVKIDYIFLSKNLSYSGSRIIQESPGDHYPVVTNIRLNWSDGMGVNDLATNFTNDTNIKNRLKTKDIMLNGTLFGQLLDEAVNSPRKRSHQNLHTTFDDPVQR